MNNYSTIILIILMTFQNVLVLTQLKNIKSNIQECSVVQQHKEPIAWFGDIV